VVAERASHTLTGEERKHHACINSSPAASSWLSVTAKNITGVRATAMAQLFLAQASLT
jgi:hypothetical protein